LSAEPSAEELARLNDKLNLLIEIEQYKKEHKRDYVTEDYWYPWQHEGFETQAMQWMTIAGNQVGKTISEGYHFALDVTGQYPDWWRGYRFEHAPNCLALGVDSEQLRTVIQPELFGEVVDPPVGKKFFSGGWIHRGEIGRIEWSQVPNVAKRVEVFSKYGRSSVVLRTSSQSKTGSGSLSFAGTRICRIWVDECPPDELIGQLNVRTTNGNYGKGGHIGYTMTPELGKTKLVTQFMEKKSPSQHLIGPIAWADAPHITPEKQEALLAGIPEHEHDMRSKGIPFFGEGLIYTCPDKRIMCEPFRIETIPWMKFIRAMDLGISHPTAIVWMAFDPEQDVIYVLRVYSESGLTAANHAAAANSFLPFAPMVFPPDIDKREPGSGQTLRDYYYEAGLKNTYNFENPDGSRFVEPGIAEIHDMMKNGRFRVFNTCKQLFQEKSGYHREKGKIHKEGDDIMDAMRYGAMMIRTHGVPLGGHRKIGKRKKRFSWTK
jgi:hypothetical protein